MGTRIVGQVTNCSKDFGGDLYFSFCTPNETLHKDVLGNKSQWIDVPEKNFICDQYFEENEASMKQGIRGLSSTAFSENIQGKFRDKGVAISNRWVTLFQLETDKILSRYPLFHKVPEFLEV